MFIYVAAAQYFSILPVTVRLAYRRLLKYIQSARGGALLNQYYLYRSSSTFSHRYRRTLALNVYLNLTDRHGYVIYRQSITIGHSIIPRRNSVAISKKK